MAKKKPNRKMVLITVHITRQQLKALDELVESDFFPSRGEAIRVAVREMLDKYLSRKRQPLILGL